MVRPGIPRELRSRAERLSLAEAESKRIDVTVQEIGDLPKRPAPPSLVPGSPRFKHGERHYAPSMGCAMLLMGLYDSQATD